MRALEVPTIVISRSYLLDRESRQVARPFLRVPRRLSRKTVPRVGALARKMHKSMKMNGNTLALTIKGAERDKQQQTTIYRSLEIGTCPYLIPLSTQDLTYLRSSLYQSYRKTLALMI